MDGWIKLHRKIRLNPIFSDIHLLRLWIICLTEATHKERDQIVGKQVVHLMPGEFVTGRFDLHSMFNNGLKPKDRVTEYTVWRWLLTLQELEFVSIKSSNKFSIVTVVKWSEYQSHEQENEQQLSNKRAADEQQMSTNKNVKKEKNDKKVIKDIVYSPEFERFWDAYPQEKRVGKPAAFNNFKKLLKKHDAEYLIACAMNYASYCLANSTDKQYIKMPNNFLNPKDEYFKLYETPVLIHNRSSKSEPPRKETSAEKLQRMLREEQEREASGHY